MYGASLTLKVKNFGSGRTRKKDLISGVSVWSEWMKDVIAHEIMLFMKLRPEHGVNNNVASLPTLKESVIRPLS